MSDNPSRASITANGTAWLERARHPDAQMPDVIDGQDINWARHRVAKGSRSFDAIVRSAFANPAGARWGAPKHDGSTRPMVFVNPYFEWHLRLLVGTVADALVAAQSTYAHAGRFELSPPPGGDVAVLRSVSFGETHKDYRDDLAAIVRHAHRFALITDVRLFYPSLTPAVIDRELRRLHISPTVSATIAYAARQLATDAGVDGLPIGMELAGLIANLVLRRVDDALDRVPGLKFTRWSDDVTMADGSPRVVNLGFKQFAAQLETLGAAPSIAKTFRNWELGCTVEELIRSRVASQGDLRDPIRCDDLDRVEGLLSDELARHKPNPSRLRRLFGVLAEKARPSLLSRRILDRLLDDPALWQFCVARAARYMSRVGTPDDWSNMVHVALDLSSADEAASEQVVHLLRVVACNSASIQGTTRHSDANRLLDQARASHCVPIRGWARYTAYELEREMIWRQTITTGEFGDLHPFEQRVAISFAHPRRHHWWLEKQRDSGRWPITAEWRLNTR